MTQISDRIAALPADKREFLLQRLKEKLDHTKRQIVPLARQAASDFALSFAQERLWFIQQMDPDSAIYNISAALSIKGPLDRLALEQSLNQIVRRHESLRSVFVTVEGRPVQRIQPYAEFELPLTNLTGYTESEIYQSLQSYVTRPFNLATGPLVRVRLFETGPASYILLVIIHHIVSDGLSTGLFLQEIWQHYEAFVAGRSPTLPDLKVQYADWAAWQRQWLQDKNLDEQSNYWQAKLGPHLPVLDLPTDYPRQLVQTFAGAHFSFRLPASLTGRLEKFCQTEGVTLYVTMLAAFQTLLYRYTGQETVTVGSPIANRTSPEVERLIGFFVNNLVMKGDLAGRPSFREVVKRVHSTALEAYAHQDLPFERLVEKQGVARDLSRTPLFQVAFALQENPLEVAPAGLELKLLELHIPAAKFDLTLEIFKLKEGLSGWLEYNTGLFEAATIERFYHHLVQLLETVLTNPDQLITDFSLLTPAEVAQLASWNKTAQPFAADKCAHQLFEEQVARQPEALALVFGSDSLTYQALNERANRLAHYLRAQGVGPDKLVGIYAERSLDTLVAILAVLKAGGAYLPLDPAYPQERLAYMLEDSGAEVLLTSAHQPVSLATGQAQVVYLDQDWPQIEQYPTTNPAVVTNPHDLAYLIYTSGSTGKPKGVVLAHQGLVNLATVQVAAFGVGPGVRVLQFASFSFDASVWEIAMSLLSGATLYLCEAERLRQGGASVAEVLRENAINIVTLPPSLLATIPPTDLADLQTIVVAGEAVTEELVRRWATGRRFFNAYGPTETTVCATFQECWPQDEHKPLIGKPLPNTQIYLLDSYGHPVPVGVVGEIHVGGVQLALGYLNRPDLTAQKFITSPFSNDADTASHTRLYKTGDLGRFRSDGAVEFLGRIDQQVKLRGFRIELEEIQTLLCEHPAIQEAIVVVREESTTDHRLIAYFLPHADTLPTFGELRNFLKDKLPEYMLPSAFVMLSSIPLTPNGKVDKKALPAPENIKTKSNNAQVLPQTTLERTIAEVWQAVLKVDKVGIYENFFEIGGYSLLMVEIHKQLQERLGREFSIITLFKYPTIHTLAKHLAEAESGAGTGPSSQTQQSVQASQDRARQQREALARARQQMAARRPTSRS